MCQNQSPFTKAIHHQFLLLPVEYTASMKSLQALKSPAIPLTSFHEQMQLVFFNI